MFGLVGCPALQTIRKYFIIGSLISRIYCNWRPSITQPRGKEKKKHRERLKGGGEGQQKADMILNKKFSLDNSKTSDRLLKRGNWENYCFTLSLYPHFLRGWIVVSEKSATSLPLQASEFIKTIGCLQILHRNSHDMSCG